MDFDLNIRILGLDISLEELKNNQNKLHEAYHLLVKRWTIPDKNPDKYNEVLREITYAYQNILLLLSPVNTETNQKVTLSPVNTINSETNQKVMLSPVNIFHVENNEKIILNIEANHNKIIQYYMRFF